AVRAQEWESRSLYAGQLSTTGREPSRGVAFAENHDRISRRAGRLALFPRDPGTNPASVDMRARTAATALFALTIGFFGNAQAQIFPSKPVRIIVPFPPGGAADITSRVLAEHMRAGLGQPIVIENRPGGGAVIGYELAARSPGDGHTMLVVFPSFVINPSV